tara:strand:+ start:91 stop:642 length:552 start_codon:yes stop_codon:yes gene_type:complete
MNEQELFALIDSLTKGQGEMSKTPMGREVLFMTDPNIGVGAPENIDIQELIRGMIDPKSPIRSQFSSALGRNKLQKDVGESKSIDDIINQSNIAEFLSKAMSDKTNVDSSEIPIDDLDDKSNYYDRGFTRAETIKLKALREQRRKDKKQLGYIYKDSPSHIINNFFGSQEKDEELILKERKRK